MVLFPLFSVYSAIMAILPKRREISYAAYQKEDEAGLEVRYGLPSEIRFCVSCVISNQRPCSSLEYKHTKETKKASIYFDEEDICDACRSTKSKENIDWQEREKELMELCDRYRSTDGAYDCLVPGSGGKDSFYAAHLLKYKYKMNPLTVTWAPHIYTEWGWRNHQSWIHAGFDNILFYPNGRTHRLLTRLSCENLLHPFQPFILGQKLLPPKIADQYNIKLIFYGENEAEYGNPIKDMKSSQRDKKFFVAEDTSNTYVAGVSVKDLMKVYGIDQQSLNLYLPLEAERFETSAMQVHYLGYYVKWHPQSCYYYAVEHGGFEVSPERTAGTYSKYNSIDDKIDDLHYYTTYIKFGIGRATYDASQELRSGDITREEAIHLVRRYDGEYPERFEKECFNYLSISEKEFPVAAEHFEQRIIDRDYFQNLVDSFRSPHIWKYQNGNWILRSTVWQDKVNIPYIERETPSVEASKNIYP